MSVLRHAGTAARSAFYKLPKRLRSRIRKKAAESAIISRAIEATAGPHAKAKLLANEAKRHLTEWNLEQALECANAALALRPKHLSAMHMKVNVLGLLGRIDEAIETATTTLSLHPLDLQTVLQLKALGSPPEISAVVANQFLDSYGRTPQNLHRAARYLDEGVLHEEALLIANEGIGHFPEEPTGAEAQTFHKLLFEKAAALRGLDRLDEALAAFARIRDSSQTFKHAANPYAAILLDVDRVDEAESILWKAGAHPTGPIPHNGMLIGVYYRQDRIGEAHAVYRRRATSREIANLFGSSVDPTTIALKPGDYRDKSAMILAEGGPGDEIRKASLYPELPQYFNSLTLTCEPRLHSLFQRSFPAASFIPVTRYRKEFLGNGIEKRTRLTTHSLYTCASDEVIDAATGTDFGCSVLDTLAELRAAREDFPKQKGYLKPDPDLTAYWRQKVDGNGRLKVGLAWRSLLLSNARNRHYLRAEDLAPLAQLQNVDFWVMQPKVADEELDILRQHFPVHVPEGLDFKDDFEAQAAFNANMDVVIAPLTTTAELSGALGVRTLIFCRSHTASWRRNPDGSDVWYSNSRPVMGDPILDTADLLSKLVSEIRMLQQR